MALALVMGASELVVALVVFFAIRLSRRPKRPTPPRRAQQQPFNLNRLLREHTVRDLRQALVDKTVALDVAKRQRREANVRLARAIYAKAPQTRIDELESAAANADDQVLALTTGLDEIRSRLAVFPCG